DLGRLCRDAVRWRISPRRLEPAGEQLHGRRGPDAAQTLPVAKVASDGLLTRSDGVLVRYLRVAPVNPLVLDPGEAERVSRGFAQLAARLQDGQSLQLYTFASPLDFEGLCDSERAVCEHAAVACEREHPGRAAAMRELEGLAEESVWEMAARTRP